MSDLSELLQCDVLIIGCGIAGATAALELSRDPSLNILVVTKAEDPHDSNTYHAQGGIIYKGDEDSPDKLVADLLRAGDDMNNRRAVRILAEDGPRLVRELLIDTYKVPFTVDADNNLELTREAAHSVSRILHANDATGRAIQERLVAALHQQPNIRLLTDHTAVDLLTPAHHSIDRLANYEPLSCIGAYVYDQRECCVRRVLAKITVLATGGLGRIFLYTSNPSGATGDGLAMADRAGARIINAEYVQFHPTTFYFQGQARFLVSEALRGEGALLLNSRGERFMERYAPEWKELAPRDVVARSIHLEMLRTGSPCVFLDIASQMPADRIAERFPTIRAYCQEYDTDPACEPIPVVPAAHYFCGGVWVDEWGITSIERLYTIGEVSCTGVHGANRLGSASLLEGLVWGERAAHNIRLRLAELELYPSGKIPPWQETNVTDEADPVLVENDMLTIRHTMWYYVGLVRSQKRLERALDDLGMLQQDIDRFYRTSRLNARVISLRNAVLAASIVARSAWANPESHGCHYRED